MMKISNVRLGHATNSSSSHSIIVGFRGAKDHYTPGEFGWDNFTLASRTAKDDYLATTLLNNLQSTVGQDIAKSVVAGWIGITCEDEEEPYVDHQSLMTLPNDMRTGQVSREFFNDLREYYLRDDLAILGGNDNGDGPLHPLQCEDGWREHLVPTEATNVRWCRKDGDWWVLFNRENGTKIRLSFKDNSPPYEKASWPELVDIKITDKCLRGCEFCYQDSTPGGEHADKGYVDSLLYALKDLGVFEISLGGGEPTLHPEFHEFIRTARNAGIVPNFTSGSWQAVYDSFGNNSIADVGRFGVTVKCWDDVATIYSTIWSRKDLREKASCQYVMGSTDMPTFHRLVEQVYSYDPKKSTTLNLLLLGYKRTGRGTDFKPYDYSGWLDVIKSHVQPYRRIGIDTALANEHKEELLKEVPPQLITFMEGKFSMYVDAVMKRIAPSSYAPESEFVSLDSPYKVAEVFAEF